MSIVRCYLRIAPTTRGFRVAATTKPSSTPLSEADGTPMPTLQVGLMLKLPAGAFEPPMIAELEVQRGQLRPVVEASVTEPEAAA